ncbi:MAG: hypothetical protein IJJ41_01355 [Clostridia bacterium]|nr:hypothetical protein [Clostridia bacterium]MBR0413723.1 hypothetical protein [Clostridia bacterium]
MSEKKMNGEYEIIQTLIIGDAVLALGHNPNIPENNMTTPYVTWQANEDLTNFYWGHYHKSLYAAQRDLVKRGVEKVRFYDRQNGFTKTHKERDAR